MVYRPGGSNIRFVSWNCKGVIEPVKHSKVFHQLYQLGTHIVYLQETHLKAKDQLLIKKMGWTSLPFHVSG